MLVDCIGVCQLWSHSSFSVVFVLSASPSTLAPSSFTWLPEKNYTTQHMIKRVWGRFNFNNDERNCSGDPLCYVFANFVLITLWSSPWFDHQTCLWLDHKPHPPKDTTNGINVPDDDCAGTITVSKNMRFSTSITVNSRPIVRDIVN